MSLDFVKRPLWVGGGRVEVVTMLPPPRSIGNL